MNMSLILDFLETQPEGATPHEIADHVDGNARSVRDSLGRLESKGLVKNLGATRMGLHSRWISTREKAQSVYHGDETLAAMQAACRARLMGELAEAA
jgi:DNA-binding IclR family transcriptional regulator